MASPALGDLGGARWPSSDTKDVQYMLRFLPFVVALLLGLVTAGPAIAAPSALTLPPENVTSVSASIRGFVDGDDAPSGAVADVDFYFQYGPTTAYEYAPTAQRSSPADADQGRTVAEAVAGLAPSTTYHYRVVAVKNGVTTFGTDTSLHTAPAPDADGDGTPDAQDACPSVSGPPAGGGCPPAADRDGDGTPDSTDACPDKPDTASPGYRGANGCPEPDTDGDGVVDIADKCPTVAANSSTPGCPPDRDGDGIVDGVDQCPDLRGTGEADGCKHGVTKIRLGTPLVGPVRNSPTFAQQLTFSAMVTTFADRLNVTFDFSSSPTFAQGESAGCGSSACQQTDQCVAVATGQPGVETRVSCETGGAAQDSKLIRAKPLYVRVHVFDPDTSKDVVDAQSYLQLLGDDVDESPIGGKGTAPKATSLRDALAPTGDAAGIDALLGAGGYTAALAAPSAGTASIEWKAKNKRVAYGSTKVTKAGTATIKVKLTKAGRTLLKGSAATVKITATGSFKPKGKKATTSKRTITLKH